MKRKKFLSASAASLPALSLQANSYPKKKAKRILFLSTSLGFLPQYFNPKGTGKNYKASPYLEHFSKCRQDMTVFTGLSHHGLLGSLHQSERCFLTAEQNASNPSFKNSISIDQIIAKQLSDQTRHAFLNLSLGPRGLVHNQAGVMIPPLNNHNKLYDFLFKEKSSQQIIQERKELETKREILKTSLLNHSETNSIHKNYKNYSLKLISDIDKKISWLSKPIEKIYEKLKHHNLKDPELLKRHENFLTCIRLAFQADIARVAVLHIPFYNKVPIIEGVDTSWHRLTHLPHKKDKLKQLISIEHRLLKQIANFLSDLKATSTKEGNLLDETIVLIGSNLGESNSHNPTNLPILVAGGPFEHGKHIAFPKNNNVALSRLFLSLSNSIQGVQVQQFKHEKQSLGNIFI